MQASLSLSMFAHAAEATMQVHFKVKAWSASEMAHPIYTRCRPGGFSVPRMRLHVSTAIFAPGVVVTLGPPAGVVFPAVTSPPVLVGVPRSDARQTRDFRGPFPIRKAAGRNELNHALVQLDARRKFPGSHRFSYGAAGPTAGRPAFQPTLHHVRRLYSMPAGSTAPRKNTRRHGDARLCPALPLKR